MTAEDITVELRLEKFGNDGRGLADVTLSLGEYGILTLHGFSISGRRLPGLSGYDGQTTSGKTVHCVLS